MIDTVGLNDILLELIFNLDQMGINLVLQHYGHWTRKEKK